MPPSWMEVHYTLILKNYSKAEKSAKASNEWSFECSEYLLMLSYLEIYPPMTLTMGKNWSQEIIFSPHIKNFD